MRELYQSHMDPGGFESTDGPLAEYMIWRCKSDESIGDDSFGYWVGRYGKRLLSQDSCGFFTLSKYATIEDAQDDFMETVKAYTEWLDEPSE